MAAEPVYSSSLRVALVGAGSVGTSVATLLSARGHEIVSVWSRSPASAERAAAALRAPVASSPSAAGEADVVLVGVVDSALPEVVEELAAGLRAGTVVVHFAGALGVAPLEPAARLGAHVAALHPVQSIPDTSAGVELLPGSAWGVTCASPLVRWAHDFVQSLDGLPVDVDERDRGPWHAAAVMTSNGIAALMSTGEALLAEVGIADPRSVLSPLAAGTLANVRALGRPGEAYTGPVVRGDRATVETHLTSLRARFPALLGEYTLIARAIVAGAARTGRIEAGAARSMNDLLESA